MKFINPLLRSPIVGDVAYGTLVKLSKCTATPLCNWALEIATALRLIMSEDVNVLWGKIPSAGEEVSNEKPGLFERVTNGLSISCKTGALPVDSFTFVFPVSLWSDHVNFIFLVVILSFVTETLTFSDIHIFFFLLHA